MPEEVAVAFPSGDLQLEGRLHHGTTNGAAVVLHPHPRYGGDMDNHVVVTVCEALASIGSTTLRFNFRGVGLSNGAFHGHGGEVDDAHAAITFLRSEMPDAKLVVAGYSFGAAIAAAISRHVEPVASILRSLPLSTTQTPDLSDRTPTLLVTGELDSIAPASLLYEYASQNRTVLVVPGADHGWWPGTEALYDAVSSFAMARLAP